MHIKFVKSVNQRVFNKKYICKTWHFGKKIIYLQ